MKKIALLAVVMFTTIITFAQNYNKVQTAFLINKFEDAKTEIDKIAADPKAQSKVETWLWKARVYAALYKDEALSQKYPNALTEANSSFLKYEEMDPELKMLKEVGVNCVFDIYSTSFNNGIKAFQSKSWDDAYTFFGYAVKYSDKIFANKWTESTAPFDTTAILYCGYSAQNAKKANLAIEQYTRLAKAGVNNEEFLDMYRYILDYAAEQKDEAKFKEGLGYARAAYPAQADLWDSYEMEFLSKTLNLTQLKDYYNANQASFSATQFESFGSIFATADSYEGGEGMDSTTIEAYKDLAYEAFKKAFEMKPTGIGAYNAGVIYYNKYNTVDDRYRANTRKLQELNSNKPVEKDPKKKAEAEKKFKAETDAIKAANELVDQERIKYVDIALEWMNKSFTLLEAKEKRSRTETSVLNKTVDMLSIMYDFKRNKVRGKDTAAFDKYDALYKKFDELHNKF